MASTYLNRNASATATTFTYSVWLKRSSLASDYQYFFSYQSSGGGSNAYGLAFNGSTNKMYYYGTGGTATTDAVFRDPSAWYHVVLSVSSGTGTLYVNNQTVKSSIAVNQVTSGEGMTIGAYKYGSTIDYQFDGYMAHAHFTDGYAYTPTTFGSTSTNGQWVPTQTPSVTYGTNGFFLKFTNASDLGEDFSGNNNDFTKSGSGDKVLDNPENVFATWNTAIPMNSTMTMAKGNLEGKTGSNYAAGASNTWFSTMGVSSGKWYAEFKMTQNSASYGSLVGVSYDINTNQQGSTANAQNFCQHSSMTSGWGYSNDGSWFNGGTNTGFATYTTNDIIGVALDLDNSKLYWSKNGTYQNSANPATGSNGISIDANKEYFFAISDTSLSNTFTFQANFGNPIYSIASGNADGNGEGNFEYAPPTGYLALCTNNVSSELTLPIGKGSTYFNTVLYSGNGSSQSITGVGFSPDFLWLKERSSGSQHQLFQDADGGVPKFMQSSSTIAEVQDSAVVSSFDSDGFSVGSSGGSNQSGQTYVGWNWYTGASYVSNTDGSTTSTISANTTSGFSIVTWTGTGSGSTSVGHGLGKVPAMIIVKDRVNTHSWNVYHQSIGNNSGVNLNNTNAQSGADSGWWNNTTPTSSVFTLGTYANASSNFLAYVFAEIEGYSKFGSYTGNGSTDGAYIHLGFKPKWLLQRRTNASGQGWTIQNSDNQSYNEINNYLFAQSSGSTFSGYAQIDFLSNGFKIRSADPQTNGSGDTYIYMAFAENPFVDSAGVPTTAR